MSKCHIVGNHVAVQTVSALLSALLILCIQYGYKPGPEVIKLFMLSLTA